jgi:hypothetical protein
LTRLFDDLQRTRPNPRTDASTDERDHSDFAQIRSELAQRRQQVEGYRCIVHFVSTVTVFVCVVWVATVFVVIQFDADYDAADSELKKFVSIYFDKAALSATNVRNGVPIGSGSTEVDDRSSEITSMRRKHETIVQRLRSSLALPKGGNASSQERMGKFQVLRAVTDALRTCWGWVVYVLFTLSVTVVFLAGGKRP